MCKYCDYDSDDNEVFIDPLTNEWYLSVETFEWDDWEDEYIHKKVYGIQYCPYCGRRLNE